MDVQTPQGREEPIPLIKEGIFTTTPEPRLIGSRCRNCREVYFPARLICAHCFGEDLERVKLSRQGVITNYTIVRQPPPGYHGSIPYVLAEIEFPAEQIRLISYVTGFDNVTQVDVGISVEMILMPFRNEEGQNVLGYAFRVISDEASRQF